MNEKIVLAAKILKRNLKVLKVLLKQAKKNYRIKFSKRRIKKNLDKYLKKNICLTMKKILG